MSFEKQETIVDIAMECLSAERIECSRRFARLSGQSDAIESQKLLNRIDVLNQMIMRMAAHAT